MNSKKAKMLRHLANKEYHRIFGKDASKEYIRQVKDNYKKLTSSQRKTERIYG